MSTTTSTTHNDRADVFAGRTIAQWFCLLGGITLILVGLLGFISESSFSTADELDRGSFLGFDVNGWHNLIHIATGAFLLSGAPKRKSARTVALAFGAAYLLVTLIGIIDGNDLFGLAPINGADNVLHAVLALAAIAAALASRADDDVRGPGVAQTGATSGQVSERRTVPTGGRFQAGEQPTASEESSTRRP